MLELLKYVYILDNDKIKNSVDNLWNRYQAILDNKNSDWEEVNEARAILYFLGHIFVEIIALESLERRLKFIEPTISIDTFLSAIDSQDEEILKKYKRNEKFNSLKEFYIIVKNLKNKVNRDGTYLDEETFDKKYNKLKPKSYF